MNSQSWDEWVRVRLDGVKRRDWKPSAADTHNPESFMAVLFAANATSLIEILTEMVPTHSLDKLGAEFATYTEVPDLFPMFSRTRSSVAAREAGADIYAESRRLSLAEANREVTVAGTIFAYLSGLAVPDGFAALHAAIMMSTTRENWAVIDG